MSEEPVERHASRGEPNVRTILVVDDDLMTVNAVSHVLQEHGFQVLVATSVEQAIRVFDDAGATIDLVITDMVMPEIGGGFRGAAYHQGEHLIEHLRSGVPGGGADGKGTLQQHPACSKLVVLDKREVGRNVSGVFEPD